MEDLLFNVLTTKTEKKARAIYKIQENNDIRKIKQKSNTFTSMRTSIKEMEK